MKDIVVKIEDGICEIIEKWMPEKPISQILAEFAKRIAERCPSEEEYKYGGFLVCDHCREKCIEFYGDHEVADEIPEEFLIFDEYGDDILGVCDICGRQCDVTELNYLESSDYDVDVYDIF